MIKVYTKESIVIDLSIKEAAILRDFLSSFKAETIQDFNVDNVLGSLLTQLRDNIYD